MNYIRSEQEDVVLHSRDPDPDAWVDLLKTGADPKDLIRGHMQTVHGGQPPSTGFWVLLLRKITNFDT